MSDTIVDVVVNAMNDTSNNDVVGGVINGTVQPILYDKIPTLRRLNIYAYPPEVTGNKKVVDLTLGPTTFVDIPVNEKGYVQVKAFIGQVMKVHFKGIAGYISPSVYSVILPECDEYYVSGTYKKSNVGIGTSTVSNVGVGTTPGTQSVGIGTGVSAAGTCSKVNNII